MSPAARQITGLLIMAAWLAGVSAAGVDWLAAATLAVYLGAAASVAHDAACRRLGSPFVVYGLHDERGNLIYIGSTEDLEERLRRHLAERDVEPWREHIARVQVIRWTHSRRHATHLERRRIRSLHPAERARYTVQIRNDVWHGPTGNPVATGYRWAWMRLYGAEQILRPQLRWLRNADTWPVPGAGPLTAASGDQADAWQAEADDPADDAEDDAEPVLVATYQRPPGRPQPPTFGELPAGPATSGKRRNASRVTPHTPPVGGCDTATGTMGGHSGGSVTGHSDSRPLADLIADAHQRHVRKVTGGAKGRRKAAPADTDATAASPPPASDRPTDQPADEDPDERRRRVNRERQQRYRQRTRAKKAE